MGFAAGFAAGYNAVDKAITRKEARDKAIVDAKTKADKIIKDDMNNYMKISDEQFKIINETTAANADSSGITSEDFNKNVGKINAAKEYFAKQANNPNRTPAMAAYDKSLGLDLNPSEPQVSVSIDSYDGGKKDVYLPESMSSMSDSLVYGEDKTIHQYAMDGDKYDKKVTNPTGYVPLNLKDDTTGDTSKFAKVTYKDGTVKERVFTNDELLALSKDNSVSSVNKQYKPSEDSDGYTWKDLPKEAQDKALKEGKSLDDPVTNSVYNSHWGKDKSAGSKTGGAGTGVVTVNIDGKPRTVTREDAINKKLETWQNPTEQENNVKSIFESKEFQEKHKGKSDTEKLLLARKENFDFELSTNPKNADKYVDVVGSTFDVNSANGDYNNVYNELNPKDKAALHRYQNVSPEGKTHEKDYKNNSIKIEGLERKVEAVNNMSADDWQKGFGSDIWNKLKSVIPDNWNTLSPDEKRSSLMAVKGQGILGNLFFTYLNDVNKGAPSNADMEVMKNIITGGSSASLSSTKEAVNTWFKGIAHESSKYYDANMPKIFTKVGKNEKSAYNRIKKKYGKEKMKTVPTFAQAKARYPGLTQEEYNKRIGE